ncbi:MAG: YncE family protein [Acidobacteriota bacterium]
MMLSPVCRFRRQLLALLVGGVLATGAAAGETLVVANKSEATVSLLDLTSQQVVATLPTGEGPHEVAVSPNGRQALISNYGRRGAPGRTLTLIDIPRARVLKTLDLGYPRPHGIVWLDDRHAVITVEGAQKVVELDVEDGKILRELATDQEISHMLAADPASERAYVTSIGSGTLTVFDLADGKRLRHVATGEGAEGVAVTPDGKRVWVTNRGADTVSVVDATSLETVQQLAVSGFPIRIQITPDGGHALVANARAGDLAWIATSPPYRIERIALPLDRKDVEGRLFRDRFGDSSVPIGIVIHPSGKTAYVAHSNSDAISVIDLEQRQRKGLLTAGKEPDGMGYSPLEVASKR